MRLFRRLAASLILSAIQLSAGGVFLYEIGTNDLRLAAAGWSARANDAGTAFTNQAGMTRLCNQETLVGLQAMYNHIQFDPDSRTTVRGSDGDASFWFPAGGLYAVEPLCENLALGWATLGYFGSTLDFGDHWVGRYYVEKCTLMGFNAVPSLACRVLDSLSVGVGANVMYGILREQAGINNILDGGRDGKVRIHDYRWGGGFTAGALYESSDCTRFGVQYYSRVRFKFRTSPEFVDIGPLLTDALTRTGLLNSRVLMTIRVPQWIMGSFYHELCPGFAIMGNIGWQQWSKFGKFQITLTDTSSTTLSAIIPYKDTWHYAIGAEYRWNCSLLTSCGIAYDSSAVSNKNRTFDFPVGKQWRFGVGAEYHYNSGIYLSAGYEYIWTGDLSVDQNRGPLVGRVSGQFSRVYAHMMDVCLRMVF